ncbi:HAD family hydrolase [Longirhabdus pacifica]|uniref:HAD family hydrolase n=1 Tax=Longirhabdus pacifica TaxID=2305227 RepID=UPI001008A26C|nr:HAD family hydrolase [Longirhabdus pacifica]
MALKVIIFDLDDTLLWDEKCVKEAFAATCKLASSHHDVDPIQLEQSVRSEARKLYASYPTYAFTQNIGINPFEGLWGNFTGGEADSFRQLEQLVPQYRKMSWTNGLQSLGIDDVALGEQLGEYFASQRRQQAHLFEEAIQVLTKLKESYQLALLTNGAPDLQKEKLDGVPELTSYFDHIFISGDFGQGKPSPEIFQYVLGELHIQADEAIMVGDNLMTDIKGANSVQMPSVWINRSEKEKRNDVIPTYEIKHLDELFSIIKEDHVAEINGNK